MFSESQLYRLKYQHQTIGELVTGLTGEQLGQPVNPGKWTAQQNIAHLTAYQPAFIERMKRIQNEHEPLFERYVADNDPAFAEASERSVPELMKQYETDRKAITEMLVSLDDEALKRIGIHARYGKLCVPQWIEFFLLHEAHHLFTVFMLCADLRKTTSNTEPPTSN